MIDNSNLIAFIDNEKNNISTIMASKVISLSDKNKLLEYSFFNVMVEFTVFVSNSFQEYACGEKSIVDYAPRRKLTFENIGHLKAFFKSIGKDYVESFDKEIKEYSKHIFADRDDPFADVIGMSNLWNNYWQAKYIRDYIAHRSNASEVEYKTAFGVDNTGKTQAPAVVLSKKKNKRSLYTEICESFKLISEIIVDPRPSRR